VNESVMDSVQVENKGRRTGNSTHRYLWRVCYKGKERHGSSVKGLAGETVYS
jgi:hypothetical protein